MEWNLGAPIGWIEEPQLKAIITGEMSEKLGKIKRFNKIK